MSLPKYPAYKDSGVSWLGEVPAHWEIAPIKRAVCSFEQGWSPQCENFAAESASEWGVLKVGCVNGGVFRSTENKKLPDELSPLIQYSLKKGDLLISRANTRELVGSAAVVPRDFDNLLLCDKLYRARTNLGYAFVAYLALFLGTPEARSQIELAATGASSSMLNIGQAAILDLPIPRFEQTEMNAILAFLDRETAKIDALIAEQEKLIALLAEKRQATISRAVTRGLDPNVPLKDSGVPWLGNVPAHWEVKQLRYFAEVLRGKFTHRPRNDPAFYDGDFPFIQTGDITSADRYIREFKQTLNERGVGVSKEFPKGTLVMAIAANVGDVAILDFAAYFPDSIVGLVPNANSDLLFLYFLMGAMKQQFMRTATVSTQMNLNVDQITSLLAACPPICEQSAIVRFLNEELVKVDALRATAEKAIQLLKERRSALISAAVTGKIDVRGLAA